MNTPLGEGEAGSCRLWAQSSGAFVFALGVLVLAGWTFDVAVLKSVLPGWVTMKANTALAFALSGAALFLLSRKRSPKAGHWAGRMLGAGVALVGLLTLIEYIFRCNLGIDPLLFREAPAAVATYSPGRMALTTAISFLCTGLALAFMDARTRRGGRPAQYLVLPVAGLALLVLVGYLFEPTSFYRFGLFTAMALHTATAFVALSAGVLLARPRHVLASMLSDTGPGGAVARRLLPAALLVPVVLGWLRVQGERAGYFDSQVGVALVACCYIVILVALTLWVVGSVRRTDIERQRVANRDLRAKQEWERTFDAVPDLIAIIDDQRRVTRVNRAMAQHLGATPQQCVGLRCDEAVYGMDHRSEYFPHVLTGAGRTEHADEANMNRPDSDFLVTTTPMSDPQGRFIGAVHVARDISRRNRAEEALRALSLRQEAILAAVPDIIMEVDRHKVYAWANPAGVEFFGEDVIGKEAAFYFEGEQDTDDVVRRLFEGSEQVIYAESWQRRKDGQRRLIAWWRRGLKDENGNVTGALSSGRDITERRQAEAELLRKTALLESQVEASLDGLLVVDSRMQVILTNQRLLNMWQVPQHIREDTNDEALLQYVVGRTKYPREFLDKVNYLYAHDNETSRDEIEFKDGTVMDRYSSPVIDRNGRSFGRIWTFRDITERKRAETALQESEERYRSLVEMSPDAILVERNGTYVYSNAAGAKLLGASAASELIGRQAMDFIPVEDRELVTREMRRLEEGDAPVSSAEQPHVRLDGKLVLTELSALNMTYEGKPAVQVTLRDIMKRQELQRQFLQAQKLEAIGRLAAGIAHEINTPTQYIGDNVRFLQRSLPDLAGLLRKVEARLADGGITSEEQAGLLDAFRKADADYLTGEIPKAIDQSIEGIAHVARIVGALKEFSHPSTREKELVDLNRALDNVIIMSRNGWKYVAEVVTHFDPDLPAVPCLPGELNQSLLNILVNASQAVEDAVGKDAGRKGTITVTTRSDDGWVEVRIADTGPGIPESIRNSVFDPFFTTKEVGRGTGQGLSIARSVVVEKHGGTLTFESEVGKGTTFIIRLPVTEPAKKETP